MQPSLFAPEVDAPQITLRPYQQEAHDAIMGGIERGINRQVVSLATGGGKTILFASLVTDLPCPTPVATKVLVLAHRKELVHQNAEKIGWVNPHAKIGIEQGPNKADPNCDVISGTVQTVSRRLDKYNPDLYKAIIVDEVHHCTEDNESYMSILRHFGVDRDGTDKCLLGVTATVKRADGKGLKHTFDEITYHKGMRDGIEERWLAPLRALRIDSGTDISGVTVRNRDFAENELAEVIDNDERNNTIYEAWYNYAHKANRKSTLIFCANRKHLWSCMELFRQYGVDARGVDGETPEEERKAIVDEFLEGKYPVLINCAVMTEGTDFPNCDTLIMARPCRSTPLYIQCVGRGTRLPKGFNSMVEVDKSNEDIKRDCLILDVVDICGKHSLITTPVLFDLKQDFDAEGELMHKAARQVEKEIAKNPNAALAKTVKEAKKIVAEEIDLFSVREPDEEYSNLTDLRWKQGEVEGEVFFRAEIPKPGSRQPNDGYVSIQRDAMDDVVVKYHDPSGDSQVVHTAPDIDEAFRSADGYIEQSFGDTISLLKKEEPWHTLPASDAQKSYMNKLNIVFDDDVNRLQASELISNAKGQNFRSNKQRSSYKRPRIDVVSTGPLA